MKKKKAIIITLLLSGIGFSYLKPAVSTVYAIGEIREQEESETHGVSEEAASGENETPSSEEDGEQTESGESETQNTEEECDAEEGGSQEEQETTEQVETGELADESGQIEKKWRTEEGFTSLQVPQKFDITMDPLEMDGKTQVYSGEYVIKNTGSAEGMLKLTGIADGIGNKVHIQTDNDSVHDGNGKNIFIELIINEEDKIVLSPEGTDYEIMLEPNAGVKLTFVGEMNENASEDWVDSDVKISVIYEWETADEEGKMTEEESTGIGTGKEAADEEKEGKTTEEESTDIVTEEETGGEETEEGATEEESTETENEEDVTGSGDETVTEETEKATGETSDTEQNEEETRQEYWEAGAETEHE